MYQLQPNEQFPIVHLIGDPNDSATYYARAVVRDPVTGVTVATITLTNQGGGIFSYVYQVPSGHRYLTITIGTYTDSGFTTPAGYPFSSELYLIAQRWSRALGGSGVGGGSSLTAKEVRQIIKEAVSAIDLTSIYEGMTQQINVVNKAIADIKIPKPASLDAITSVLATLEKKIAAIPVSVAAKPEEVASASKELSALISAAQDAIVGAIPTPEKVDLNPVHEAIAILGRALTTGLRSMREEVAKKRTIQLGAINMTEDAGEEEDAPSNENENRANNILGIRR